MVSETINFNNQETKLTWKNELYNPNLEVRQVSGIIYDKAWENILIVKNDSGWVIPGGHPESGEEVLTTLRRETLEESGYLIKNVEYLGFNLVEEAGSTYQQLRYTAQITEDKPQELNLETTEVKLIPFNKISDYIKWAKGKVAGAMFNQAYKRVESIKNDNVTDQN